MATGDRARFMRLRGGASWGSCISEFYQYNLAEERDLALRRSGASHPFESGHAAQISKLAGVRPGARCVGTCPYGILEGLPVQLRPSIQRFQRGEP